MSLRVPGRFTTTLAGFVVALTASAAAQTFATGVWSAAGNSGAVDSTQQSVYQTNGTGSVQVKSNATGTIVLRYNVSGMPRVFRQPYDPEDDGPDQRIQLMARLRDTGAGARVVVRLRELNLATGSLRTLALINSDNSFSSGTEYFNEIVYLSVDEEFQFDYWRFAYYIEAELSKTTATANPGLMAVQVCNPAGACQEGI
jgi:hypothetical protein